VTRALVWKEVREQGTVLVALVVLGAAVLIAASVLMESTSAGSATELRSLTAVGRIGLLMLTVTAGMVVGGTLFAGEREAGTFAFLDMLPGSRWRVWWRKVVTGCVLVGVAVGVFLAVSAVGGILDLRTQRTAWLLLFGSVALAAYGWGVLGSVLARTSLTACGAGLGYAMLTLCVVYPVVGIGLNLVRRPLHLGQYIGNEAGAWELASLVTGYTLMAIPIPIAAWLFTAPDRARKLAESHIRLPGVHGVVATGLRGVSGVRWGAGWRRLLWLTVRQTRWPALALVAAALVAGCALLPREGAALAIWPILGLGVGVLVGVIGLADEQGAAAYRFWGERRMPIRRLWTAKVVAGLGLTLLLVVMLLVPSISAAIFREDHGPRRPFVALALRSGVLAEPGFPALTFLLVWPAYGFAFGHLAGMLFRKGVVAGAVGIMVGGTFAALWLPSLLAGGVHGWQVFAAPLAALLTARLLTWPWATDRLGTRRPLLRLAAGAVAVLAVTAAGIGYRVAEAPLVADVEDDLAFAQTLPSFDEKQAGRDLRRAASQFNEIPFTVRMEKPDVPLSGGAHLTGPDVSAQTYLVQLPAVLENGWPKDRPDLTQWLDAMTATGWIASLETAAAKPTGVLEDPAELAPMTPLRNIDGMRQLFPLYLARALQRQSAGDPAEMPKTLAVALATIRTTRKDTIRVSVLVSNGMELQTYQALDRWLERVAGRPDLLRQALAAGQEMERTDPYDPRAVLLAEQVVARNAVLAPSRWLAKYFDELRQGRADGTLSPTAEAEANLVGFAWAVPWERERLRRTIGLGNSPGREPMESALLRGMPGWFMLVNRGPGRQNISDGRNLVLAARRAAMLKLAVRLHEAETGSVPDSLARLVPKYLPEVPADPFDGKPMRYRVSAGEQITQNRPTPAASTIPNPPGMGVFMSDDEYTAFAGIGGGLVNWPLEPGGVSTSYPPPGLFPEFLSESQITAVAGTAGGAAFWPRVPSWGFPEPEPIVIPGGAVLNPGPHWDRRWTQEQPTRTPVAEVMTVPAGQAIIWSVGPDQVDNLGTVAIAPGMVSQHPSGDLVYLVPRPTRPEEK
jgi:hypothetical protein